MCMFKILAELVEFVRPVTKACGIFNYGILPSSFGGQLRTMEKTVDIVWGSLGQVGTQDAFS